MNKYMKIVLLILGIIGLILCFIWWYKERGWEPVVCIVAALSTVITLSYELNKKEGQSNNTIEIENNINSPVANNIETQNNYYIKKEEPKEDKKDYEISERDGNIRGIIIKQNKSDNTTYLTIQFGLFDPQFKFDTNIKYSGSEECFMPKNLGISIAGLENFCSVRYKITSSNELLISSEIYNIDGELTGKIIDNQFVLNKNKIYSWNSDETGFEVVDDKFEVIFSIDYIAPKTLAFQGLLYNEGEWRIIGDGDIFAADEKSKDLIIQKKKTLTPLFHYVGKDWESKRRIVKKGKQ